MIWIPKAGETGPICLSLTLNTDRMETIASHHLDENENGRFVVLVSQRRVTLHI